jgi:hypothetical protein
MTQPHLPDFEATVARCQAEVLADMNAGRVPHDVRSFSALHDHVDANCYGGSEETWYEGCCEVAEYVDFWNRVQSAVDAWLKARA